MLYSHILDNTHFSGAPGFLTLTEDHFLSPWFIFICCHIVWQWDIKFKAVMNHATKTGRYKIFIIVLHSQKKCFTSLLYRDSKFETRCTHVSRVLSRIEKLPAKKCPKLGQILI